MDSFEREGLFFHQSSLEGFCGEQNGRRRDEFRHRPFGLPRNGLNVHGNSRGTRDAAFESWRGEDAFKWSL